MDYAFKSIGRTCAASGERLPAGAACRSALVVRDGRHERLDFLATAWTGPPEGTVGHWRSQVPVPSTKPRVVDADELLRQFERLEDAGNMTVRRLRYVLALLLLQKKRLELETTRRDGEIEYLVLAGIKGEGPFEVRDEQLPPEEIAAAQAELAALPPLGDEDAAADDAEEYNAEHATLTLRPTAA